jgi:hypothetical protein
MSTGIAALIALAAVTVTYFSCVRPMLRGREHCAAGGSGPDAELDRQIAELREELRVLRAQDSMDRGRTTDA